MATLILKDDVETFSFINTPHSTYRYIDNTFDAQLPQRKEIRSELLYGFGRDLLRLSYTNRIIKFQFMVVSTTDALVHAAVTAISRTLIRAQDPIYLYGGGYKDTLLGGSEGLNTGDNGLILRYRLKDAAATSIKDELGATVTTEDILTYRIISGDLKIIDPLKSARQIQSSGAKYFALCELTLEAEPFALAEARIIAEKTSVGFYAVGTAPVTDSHHNRFHVAAASVPGDAPALTRIYTKVTNGNGIIIGRDAGISLLNSTSFPTMTGSGLNDFFVWGQWRSNSITDYYRVKISTAGATDKFQWSSDDGASWETAQNIVARTPIQLGTTGIYVYFVNQTGHTLNDYWRFRDHQTYMDGAGASSIYSSRELYYAITGATFDDVYFTIPKGCKSRYKVYAQVHITGVDEYEYRMGVSYFGIAGSSISGTSPIMYDWIKPETSTGLIDMGMIDLTPKASPFYLNPGSFGYGRLLFYMRAITNLDDPSTIELDYVLLVPAQDDNSYMHVVWNFDSAEGREVYCNFDPSNPYVGEADANHFDTNYIGTSSIIGLDYTMAGNIITLLPNIENTIVFFPVIAGPGNWRLSAVSTSVYSGETSLAIRPRYLYGG